MSPSAKIDAFRSLHRPGSPFIIANPWDAGSARILEGLGFKALATTSSGFALTKGRRDYRVSRDEAIEHCRAVSTAVDLPVSADLENGFGHRPEDAAETIRLAAEAGVCGGSIEDASGDAEAPIYPVAEAVERVRAAVEAARQAPAGFVLTARAEGFLHRQGQLDEIIERLVAFEQAGADVVYAPGLPDLESVRAVCSAVSCPVNVLIYGKLGTHSLAEFAAAGVARISVGGTLAFSVYGALTRAQALLETGTFETLAEGRANSRTIAGFLEQ